MESTQKQKSVYVVEDDIEMSTVIDRVLKSIDSNLILDWSTSAEEAIQNIHNASKKGLKKPYDLIIADVLLDGSRSGIDLWNYSKRKYPDMPIILTSAISRESLFPPGNSVQDKPIFLQKPFSITECKSIFRKILTYPDKYSGTSVAT